MPYVLDGTLPQQDDEIAVTSKYLSSTGKKLGDTVEIQEEHDDENVDNAMHFTKTEYRITAEVIDPTDVNAAEGVVLFRSTAVTDYVFYVCAETVNSDIYSEITLKLDGAESLQCYSNDYTELMNEVKNRIEADCKVQREQARTNQIREDAQKKLDEEKQKVIDNLKQTYMNSADISNMSENAMLQSGMLFSEIPEMDMSTIDAVWYIQDRTALSGYANVDSDSNSIEAIGNVFPVIFLLVAVLISLTTVTRMVEEERGIIGTYKALGFSNREIRRKYVLFAAGSSLLGGLIGDIGGFIVLPEIIFMFFSMMYQFPGFQLSFDWTTGIGGLALFTGAILIATYVSCHEQMKQSSSDLMRTEAPKAGKKIFLENVSRIWKRIVLWIM